MPAAARAAAGKPAPAARLLLLLLLATAGAGPRRAAGQGLQLPPAEVQLGASSAGAASLSRYFNRSLAWRTAFMARPSVCSPARSSLCSANGQQSLARTAQLLMATSPQVRARVRARARRGARNMHARRCALPLRRPPQRWWPAAVRRAHPPARRLHAPCTRPCVALPAHAGF